MLSQFDIRFDMSGAIRSMVGTDGHITVTDPWIAEMRVFSWSVGAITAVSRSIRTHFRASRTRPMVRIEIDTNSDAIAGGADLEFDRQCDRSGRSN